MSNFWARLKARIGAVLSGLGLALMSIDIAGYAPQIREYAASYYPKAGSLIGAVLFALLLVRTLYVAWKLRQADVQIPGVTPPPK